jgi:hypothetical protein
MSACIPGFYQAGDVFPTKKTSERSNKRRLLASRSKNIGTRAKRT